MLADVCSQAPSRTQKHESIFGYFFGTSYATKSLYFVIFNPPPPSSKVVFKDIEIYLRITQFIFNTFNQIDFMTFCDFFHYIFFFFLNCHTDKSFLLSPPTIQNFDIWCISPLSFLCTSLMNEINLNTFNVIHKYAFYLHSRNKITNMNEHKNTVSMKHCKQLMKN